jgi:hypothetical protein
MNLKVCPAPIFYKFGSLWGCMLIHWFLIDALEQNDLELIAEEDLALAHARSCRYNCSRPYSPLCGSDRRTYGNICHLNTKNRLDGTRVRRVSSGTCPQQRCVPDVQPITCVCTDCQSNSASCSSSSNPNRPVTCSNVSRAVCGTNGVTYRNACLLSLRTACLGYPVRVCHKGPCRRSQDEDEKAPEAGIVEIDYIDE